MSQDKGWSLRIRLLEDQAKQLFLQLADLNSRLIVLSFGDLESTSSQLDAQQKIISALNCAVESLTKPIEDFKQEKDTYGLEKLFQELPNNSYTLDLVQQKAAISANLSQIIADMLQIKIDMLNARGQDHGPSKSEIPLSDDPFSSRAFDDLPVTRRVPRTSGVVRRICLTADERRQLANQLLSLQPFDLSYVLKRVNGSKKTG